MDCTLGYLERLEQTRKRADIDTQQFEGPLMEAPLAAIALRVLDCIRVSSF